MSYSKDLLLRVATSKFLSPVSGFVQVLVDWSAASGSCTFLALPQVDSQCRSVLTMINKELERSRSASTTIEKFCSVDKKRKWRMSFLTRTSAAFISFRNFAPRQDCLGRNQSAALGQRWGEQLRRGNFFYEPSPQEKKVPDRETSFCS